MIKRCFNKNLVLSAKDEQRFQSSYKFRICDKLFDVEDNKVRDHCQVKEKYRGSAHWSCNNNLKLTKKVPVIFHNLKSYNSHLIMKEIDIPNGLEKYIAFAVNNNLVFINSMQFMNSRCIG